MVNLCYVYLTTTKYENERGKGEHVVEEKGWEKATARQKSHGLSREADLTLLALPLTM